jgi:hypothetical protein
LDGFFFTINFKKLFHGFSPASHEGLAEIMEGFPELSPGLEQVVTNVNGPVIDLIVKKK